ncbi:Stp1/IreP family PP2C-type Ser/Thr phosphatase [Sulfuricystis multivorans]|uniref:Stp1/IreP family PP2C-type Ser/Thr phosphatase n=1 Tax=Sulfuricystis multivorans TaxID=2211108 RepID=UPI0024DFE39E|nr:Stp1/IreP family PP2C-type Ser/Thr phosphatase [Sulfuricystis multivorans]
MQPDFSSAIEMVALSDPGRMRRNNEDAVFADARLGLAVLADGMGGHNAGEVASNMAVTAIGSELAHAFETLPPEHLTAEGTSHACEVLDDLIRRTNAAIHLAAQQNRRYAGMGATLVVVQFYDNRLAVAHVGDSRLYRWRAGELARLTRDHSLLQEQIDRGMISPEQARHAPNRNLVTRALGVEAEVAVELAEHAVLPDDVYLLCSDGLYDMVDDEEIARALNEFSANLQLCSAQLIQIANRRGGRDNISVILARIKRPFPASA